MVRALVIAAALAAFLTLPAEAAQAPVAARLIRCHPHPNQAKRFAIFEGEWRQASRRAPAGAPIPALASRAGGAAGAGGVRRTAVNVARRATPTARMPLPAREIIVSS